MKSIQTAAVPSLMREMNERRILDILRSHGAIHAAEVARLIGLSKPTTAEILRSLTESGLVKEYTPGESDSKRARSVFEAVSDLKVTLAIDIGARFIRAAIGDLNGQIRSESSVSVKSLSLKNLVEDMHTAVAEVLKTAGFGLEDIAAIVVGTPGVVDQKEGTVSIAGTISSLDGINLAELVENEFGLLPTVENDINLVTVGEQCEGLGRGVQNFAVLSVGSGLGSGLVLNGKLHRGFRGAAGEVFYVPFGDPRDIHRSETNPSGDSIAEIARGLVKKYKSTTLSEPYTMVDILAAAMNGDELGEMVVAQEAERIALYIAAITSITDVELVVLSGGIGRQAGYFIEPMRRLLREVVPFPPRIEVSTLGNSGILIGGLSIATAQAQERVFLATHKSQAVIAVTYSRK